MRNNYRGENHNVMTIDQRSFLGRYTGNNKRRRNNNSASKSLLTDRQVNCLIQAASQIGNHGIRNAAFMLMAYRHGLRVDELIKLKWSHIDLDAGNVQVSRLKNGQQTVHSLSQQEVDYLVSLAQMYPDSEYVFITATRTLLNTSVVHKMVKRAGKEAGLSSVACHGMLQAAGGFQLTSTRPH